jgi:hypothetical protein
MGRLKLEKASPKPSESTTKSDKTDKESESLKSVKSNSKTKMISNLRTRNEKYTQNYTSINQRKLNVKSLKFRYKINLHKERESDEFEVEGRPRYQTFVAYLV